MPYQGTYRLSIFLAAVLMLAAGHSAPVCAQTSDQLLQQAQQALDQQDYAAAATALESYLAQKPDDFRAEFNLAYAYSLLKRDADAIRVYQSVLSRQPDLSAAHMNLAQLLANSQRGTDAEPHLRAVLEKEPQNAVALQLLAGILLSTKREAEAAGVLQHLIESRPNDARLQFDLAGALEPREPRQAEEHYRRALAIDPAMERAALRLAYRLLQRVATDEAAAQECIALYRSLLEKRPGETDLLVNLGSAYSERKQYQEAAEVFERARASGDRSPAIARALLQAYLNLSGPSKDAAARYSQSVMSLTQELQAADPSDIEMYLLMGRLRMDRKEYGAAAEQFNRAAKLKPDSPEPYTNLASAFYLMGEYAATIGALARVAELHEDTAGTYFLRAITLDKLQARKPAIENYEKFLALGGGKSPDQEFQARQRARILKLEIEKGIGGKR